MQQGFGETPGGGGSLGGPGLGGAGSNSTGLSFRPGPVGFLRDVRLPQSEAPPAVLRAFAARRYSAAPPRVAAVAHSPGGSTVLWASPAYGGGWCAGLQQPRRRFDRLSVSCTWPRSFLKHGIAFTGYMPRVFWGRVPQRGVRHVYLRLSNGRSLPLATSSGFFLKVIPDGVLAHAGPEALVADDRRGRHVAAQRIGPTFPLLLGFGGLTRPPGGADLARKQRLVARPTPVGSASIWSAPSDLRPAHCRWLQIRHGVYGGGCSRNGARVSGLAQVTPLRTTVRKRVVNVLWGRVGRDVAELDLRFQDGARARLVHPHGVFLYPVPASRWRTGHRPAFVEARDDQGRVLGRTLLWEYTLAGH